ncbi:MAG: orotate phosphoribosyltransferase, partial [Symbiobacteriaceae bacterium]|nr:orotate phosphoribosyltransferase [Symbiobacteriaceae bacterium]
MEGSVYSVNNEEILVLMERLGVLRYGHFLLTSGRHSDRFLLSSQLTMYPNQTQALIGLLAHKVLQAGLHPTVVIGPAMGGIILAYEMARTLGCQGMYAEKDGEGMALKRGFTLNASDTVLIVEDAVSTGGSVQKVIDALQIHAAEILGVAVLFDRSHGQVTFAGRPPIALLNLDIQSWLPEECPLCQA